VNATSEALLGKNIVIPSALWNSVIWVFRGLVAVSCAAGWSVLIDLKEMTSWRMQTLPVQLEASAQQMQSQITATEDRAQDNAEVIRQMAADITRMQIQIARLEERRQ
jgi:peptidoglycan hydrolase CwlO-like protein